MNPRLEDDGVPNPARKVDLGKIFPPPSFLLCGQQTNPKRAHVSLTQAYACEIQRRERERTFRPRLSRMLQQTIPHPGRVLSDSLLQLLPSTLHLLPLPIPVILLPLPSLLPLPFRIWVLARVVRLLPVLVSPASVVVEGVVSTSLTGLFGLLLLLARFLPAGVEDAVENVRCHIVSVVVGRRKQPPTPRRTTGPWRRVRHPPRQPRSLQSSISNNGS
jgi:hypothetical protein